MNWINLHTMNRLLALALLLLCIPETGSAQGISAQVSSKKVQVGVPFEYAVVITVNATNFVAPDLRNFEVISGPNQSSSIQYVNGTMSQQLTISYGLIARKEGKYTIGAASVMAGGQKLETNPIQIEVVKGNPGNASPADEDQKQGNKIASGDLFIRSAVSKNKCYVGEQIIITQKVYSRLQIVGFQKFAQPTYTGFYAQALESESRGQVGVENIDGINYYTYELFRTLGTANKSGKILLDPVEGDVVVRRQTQTKARNIFEQFFGSPGYEDVPVPVKSRSYAVEVLPLPEKNKPANFNGAVGDFSAKLQSNRTELKANEAFNLKLTISGKGNLKLIDAPKFEFPESFEVYDPKVAENANSKTFDYLVIPREEGDYVLEKLNFSFFSLSSKSYVTLPSPQIKIKVLPAESGSKGAQVYSPQNQLRESENDIRYIKKGDFVLQKSGREFFNSIGHVLLLLSSLLALTGAILLRNHYLRENSNLALVRQRKAARVARKSLQQAELYMKENNKDAFYTAVLLALSQYTAGKLNIPVAELSKERISSALAERRVEGELINRLTGSMSTSEFAKYAPGAVSGDLKAVYEDTSKLIIELEEVLNSKRTHEKVA